MTQLFPSTSRSRFRNIALMAALVLILILAGIYYNAFRKNEYSPIQPIPFSHKTHMRQGMNCLSCHPSAMKSPRAGIPDTQSCMGCHRHILPNSPSILRLRKTIDKDYLHYTGEPIPWIMVNRWAGHSKFSHQAHITRGVGCTDCHGNVEEMDQISVLQNRGMRWCIDCHRAPAPSLRPENEITSMNFNPEAFIKQHQNSKGKKIEKISSSELGNILQRNWKINPPIHNCSACHQ